MSRFSRQLFILLIAFLFWPHFLFGQNPGNITTAPQIWLRGDAGITAPSTGISVGTWIDQSANLRDATQATTALQPLFESGNTANSVNFNPSVQFNGIPSGNMVRMNISNSTQLGQYSLFSILRFPVGTTVTTTSLLTHNTFNCSNNKLRVKSGNLLGWTQVYATGTCSNYGDYNSTVSVPNGVPLMVTYDHAASATTISCSYLNNATPVSGIISSSNLSSSVLPLEVVGEWNFTSQPLQAYVSEILAFNGPLSTADKNKVETYLAIKYGLTLNHNYMIGNATAYIPTGYGNDIAGIGRFDNSQLLQKQSRSINNNLLTIGGGNQIAASNQLNATTNISDQEYLIWGRNLASFATTVNNTLPGNLCTAYSTLSKWKIVKSATATSGLSGVLLQVDKSLLSGTVGTAVTDFFLAIDGNSDGDYVDVTDQIIPASSLSGNIVSFSNINFDADNNGTDLFTIVTKIVRPAAPVVVSPVTYCQNQVASSLTVTSASGGTITWYTQATGGTPLPGAPTPATTAIGSTTYYASEINAAGCESQRAALVVNVVAPGAAPPVSSNTPVCEGQMLNLSVTAPANSVISWTGPNSFNAGTATPSISNVTTAATGIYTANVTSNGCPFLPATVNVVIKPKPVPPVISSSTPVCVGSPLNLFATTVTGGAYTWTGPASFTSSQQNPTVTNSAAVANNGNYLAAVTVNGCTSDISVLPVTVNTLPALPVVTSPVLICQNAVTTPLTATGQNLLWYTTPSGGTGSVTAPTPSTVNVGSTTYYVSQTVNGCEGSRNAVVVTIITQPVPPVLAADTISVCQYATPPVLSATGNALKWYQTIGGASSTIPPVPPTAIPGYYSFYVTQTINTCESNPATITVHVKPQPAVPVVTSPVVYCQSDPSIALTAVGQHLLWYTSPSASASAVAPIPSTALPDTLTYYVTQTVDGCESPKDSITVFIHLLPQAVINTGDWQVCQYDTMWFTYNGNALSAPDAQYTWSVSDGVIESGQGTSGPLIVRFNKAGTQTVSLQIDNLGCLSNLATFSVRVNDAPDLQFDFAKDACVGERISIHYLSATPGIQYYNWSFGDAQVFGNPNGDTFSVKYNMPGDKVIAVTATLGNGCASLVFADTIHVRALPEAKILTRVEEVICTEDSIMLEAAQHSSYQYHWMPERYFAINDLPLVYGVVQLTGFVKLQVTDEYHCHATDSILINTAPCCDVYFPDAFTPNGDGRNDVFRVITIGHHHISAFRIVNRWGQVVFTTGDERQGWNGLYNEMPQDAGNYYYYIRFQCSDGRDIEKKGSFLLIR